MNNFKLALQISSLFQTDQPGGVFPLSEGAIVRENILTNSMPKLIYFLHILMSLTLGHVKRIHGQYSNSSCGDACFWNYSIISQLANPKKEAY